MEPEQSNSFVLTVNFFLLIFPFDCLPCLVFNEFFISSKCKSAFSCLPSTQRLTFFLLAYIQRFLILIQFVGENLLL